MLGSTNLMLFRSVVRRCQSCEIVKGLVRYVYLSHKINAFLRLGENKWTFSSAPLSEIFTKHAEVVFESWVILSSFPTLSATLSCTSQRKLDMIYQTYHKRAEDRERRQESSKIQLILKMKWKLFGRIPRMSQPTLDEPVLTGYGIEVFPNLLELTSIWIWN